MLFNNMYNPGETFLILGGWQMKSPRSAIARKRTMSPPAQMKSMICPSYWMMKNFRRSDNNNR